MCEVRFTKFFNPYLDPKIARLALETLAVLALFTQQKKGVLPN